jgi:predicted DNA-binding mobile mystery protein A
MRGALSMTLAILAQRAGVSVSSVAQAERHEAEGRITLSTLKKLARAMDCELVYAFVPNTDLAATMKKAALQKARRLLSTADTHMTLEGQTVYSPLHERIEALADQLLAKGDIWE